jgi:OOP family OmpA-OmpF porin
MKRSRALRLLGVVAPAVLAGPFAMADDYGWYFGLNVGEARAKLDDDKIASGLLDAGFTATNIRNDGEHLGYKIFGGYQFNRYVAMESGYFDLGNHSFTATVTPPGSLRGKVKLNGVNLDFVGILPFSEQFSAFARAGLNYAEAKSTFTGTGSVVVTDRKRSERQPNWKFGAGLEYDFTESFGMRIEVERYRADDTVGNTGDIDLASLGMVFRFGREAPPAPAPIETYTPSPPPPPPAPVPVVVPPPVETERYCTLLDFGFEINKHDIQREEKEKFRVIATFLQKYPETTAVIEGHTDNVGTDDANMKLSQRRADSVVSYLIETFNIAPSRLHAVGYGESSPIADNSTEEGKRMNRRIAAVVECATDIEGLKVRPARPTMALQIDFEQNKAEVQPQYRDELHRVADFLQAHTEVTATVEGHTADTQATAEAALAISQRRADNVLNYLVDNFGVSRSRLTAKGFGNTRRSAYNSTFEGQQENRRVNIIINYPWRRH